MNDLKVISSPKRVDIAITGKCNLACRYCFFADEMVSRSDLPTESWLAFFNELGNLGVMSVTLTGGEVFTRPDLFQLIDGIVANHMRYSLLSNGTMITEQVLAQFEIGKRRQRLDSIQVSVDGSSPEVHDLSRPKSFGRAIRGLKLLKEAGYPVTVRVTINRHNVNDLENVARLLFEEVGLTSFSTNEAYACGATDRTEGNVILTPSQRQQAMQTLVELNKRYGNRINAAAGPLAFARELEKIDDALSKGQTGLPGRGTLCSCGGVFSQLAILHDGTIVPCHSLSTLRMGTVGVDKLQDVWLRHTTMVALRQRNEIPLSSLETCRDCGYLNFCAGGCPGGAVYANGDFNSRNPMNCYRVLLGKDPFVKLEENV